MREVNLAIEGIVRSSRERYIVIVAFVAASAVSMIVIAMAVTLMTVRFV